jgi:hypothetical protein
MPIGPRHIERGLATFRAGEAPVRTTEGERVQPHQTVLEMAEEVLEGRAKALADETGQTVESAMEVVADTEAGRLLRELRDGPHGHEKARDWQADLSWDRAEERFMHPVGHPVGSEARARRSADRSYSWVSDYLGRLEGKEAREEYYAALERLTIYGL